MESRQSDDIFLAAARCAECSSPACVNACPEHVDLHALFEFIAARAPEQLTWMRKAGQAENFVAEAIDKSFN
jgi:NADPH-dependent glutamate synthase beta subunit-like oxidoreductase